MNRTAFAAIAVAFLFLSGCISDWRTVAQPVNVSSTMAASKPSQIYLFSLYSGWYSDDTEFDASFSIKDQYGEYMQAPGMATVSIVDSMGDTLYNSTFRVYASDYNVTSTGYGFMNYTTSEYAWTIPYGDVAKSNYTSSSAEAYLRFVPEGGGSALSATEYYVTLPDDLLSSSSDLKSEKIINTSQIRNNLKVTVVKAGYTQSYYGGDNYAVVVDIENRGSQKLNVYLADVAVVSSGMQYSDPTITPYSSSYDPDVIYPGAKISKTMEFYDVPDSTAPKSLYMQTVASYDTTVDKQNFVFSWQ